MSTEVLSLTVLGSDRLSPHFQRVVVGGDDLRRLEHSGFDQWFRLFFRKPEQSRLTLPFDGSGSWYQQWLDCPEDIRPECRNYTVRHFRPEIGELDIDFVLHPDTSGACDTPAARWALGARPGEAIGLLDQGTTFDAPAGSLLLLVADESALPAVEGILRSLDPGARGRVVLEVPAEADIRDLQAPAGFTVDWLARAETGADAACPGELALEHLRGSPLPEADTSVFVAGESDLATGLRRHLVSAGHDRTLIRFSGYWKSERKPVPV